MSRANSNPFNDGGGGGGGGGDGSRRRGSDGRGGEGSGGGNNRVDYGTGLVNPRAAAERQKVQATPPPPSSGGGGGGGGDPFDTASSGGGGGRGAGAAVGGGTATNPFDFDADFGGKKKKGGRNVNDDDDEASRPILTGIDGAGVNDDRRKPQAQDGSGRHRRAQTAMETSSSSSRPNRIAHRSQSVNAPAVGSSGGAYGGPTGGYGASQLASWLKGNKAADDASDDLDGRGGRVGSSFAQNGGIGGGGGGLRRATMEGMNPLVMARNKAKQRKERKEQRAANKKKGKSSKAVTPWPYDDYHEVQERMCEAGGGVGVVGGGGGSASDDDDGGDAHGYRSGSDDEKKDDRHAAGAASSSTTDAVGGGGVGGGIAFERPAELPGIKEAVNGLSLVDFERKAEERAIDIVSTWLFDAGLVDELLVHGAVTSYHAPPPPSGSGSVDDSSSRGGGGGGGGGATVSSTKTSEGVEVGAHGFPILGIGDGGIKMDKETEKLRASVQRELGMVNARLNDGVAASGAEVQELVNAVAATKGDLGRLRELITYISDGCRAQGDNGEPLSDRDEFLLANFPRIRAAIHARRNLFRCFRELEFFSQMPSTCDRLREELHSGEWTENEWSTIRNVCMEHVELEILLVEAEAGMKARIDDDGDGSDEYGGYGSARSARHMGYSSAMSFRGSGGNYEMVDRFLSEHVKNVWELGDEIQMRILSGVGSAFDLALNNPAGMVALVEAVEVYERAAEQYKKKEEEEEKQRDGRRRKSSGGRQRLHFTDMRAAALQQLYQDFEVRGLEVFRGVHMQAADMADEEDAPNEQFTAVLRAATELVTEIDIVKNQMAPCFAPHWGVEALWSSCVAHVCSNQILQQIGGPDGHALPDLTVTQLLDLVAWVEYFRETIEETFPRVASMQSKKTYLDTRPDLFAGDKRAVDIDSATDSLAWVNNMLWEVHRLAQEEFLVRTRTQTDEWLNSVYAADHTKNQTSEGKLTTSLCEDVFSLAGVQLRTIRERLSKKSDALILAVCVILSHMRSKQIQSRDIFLEDLETCCAASNDFTRMSERCEDIMSELLRESEFSDDMISMLEATSNELLGLYSSDAVFAARSVHVYVFEPIKEAIAGELFGFGWEDELTNNDLALTLVRTLEDFMGDLEQFMDDFMVAKSVNALVSASVIFYVKCLLEKAESHKSNKNSVFSDNERALDRINGDIKVMRDYFESLVPNMPALAKHIEREFEILTTIHECLSIAAGVSVSDAEDFILVLQKRVRDTGLTKSIAGDLWHLVNPSQERFVWELVESMEEQLVAIAPPDDALVAEVNDRSYVRGLRLDEMTALLYMKYKRKRPVTTTALEKMVTNWKTTWTADEAESPENDF